MCTDFFSRFDPQFSPHFLLFFTSFPLSFFSSLPHIFCAKPFRIRSFGLDLAELTGYGWKKDFFEDEMLHFFQSLEASNELPVDAGQLVSIPCIVCIWPYPLVSKTLNAIAFLSE